MPAPDSPVVIKVEEGAGVQALTDALVLLQGVGITRLALVGETETGRLAGEKP